MSVCLDVYSYTWAVRVYTTEIVNLSSLHSVVICHLCITRLNHGGCFKQQTKHNQGKSFLSILTIFLFLEAQYCNERVCVCVCLSAIISSELHVRSSPIFAHVTYGRGSVLLWRRNMLRISSFMDDVIFSHKPMLLDVAAQLRRSSHAALGLAINGAYEYT